jgi:hypothetical protein
MQSPPFNHPTPYAQPHSTPQTAPPQTASTVGVVVVAVPGAWGYRIVVEAALAVALLLAFAGAPQAVLAAMILLPGLALTRKMLVLDPRTGQARGASGVRWRTSGPDIPFGALRPWVHRAVEKTRWRRAGGAVHTDTAIRSTLHLTPTGPAFAQSTSLFHGYDRFAAVTLNLVGAPVDPAVFAAAVSSERVRLWARALVTSLLTLALAVLVFVLISERGATGAIAPVLLFVALSADRWWSVFTFPVITAPRMPLGRARVASLVAHGVAALAVCASVPVALAVRAAHAEAVRARYDQLNANRESASRQDLSDRPATGVTSPVVATLPAQARGPVDLAAVRARLVAVGFRVNTPSYPRTGLSWRLEARSGGAVTVDISLRPASAPTITGQRVGPAWVAVQHRDPIARASVMRFIEGRRDTSDATLADALRSVGVARVTGRGGRAWGWIDRAEFTATAIALEEQSAYTAQACTMATEGLLCAEINRTIYRGDPNWARYALAVAADAPR